MSVVAMAGCCTLAACHGQVRDVNHLPPDVQSYLLVTTYAMAEGGLLSRVQDGALSREQVQDMSISLKYGKLMILNNLMHPSRRRRERARQAVELIIACTDQPDTLSKDAPPAPRCIPDARALLKNAGK
ncbi:hypothetical protein CFR73_00815 [Novacetimonas maltaceti]|uniref:Uncharacterized protein n=1 Tax=Novacetimonas maltaceti TaxID=1203393 RepID=A0A2S3W5A2_9PROT|nr:hypothetical protein [Novacetimonas maltaceti]POF64051.1 hypothetical protein KMAL_03170 [Novacetimonas maltaceti]PYD62149.1 hypothetical protein CFR73_00815 [Novacetimonas maltaceti]